MKKWIIIGAVLALVGGLTGAGYLLVSRLGGPGAGEDAGMRQAALDVGGAPVEVVMGEVSSVLVLDAVVRAEPGETVEARNGGTVSHLWVGEGAEVGQGAPVVDVRVPAAGGAPVIGEDGQVPDAPATEEVTLYAPAAGTVSGLEDVLVGDVLEPGAVVATVAPEEFRAVASIPPNDLYRFYEDPEDILLQIDQGPPAAACEFLSLGTAEGGGTVPEDGGGENAEGGGGGGGAELACRVPADLEVFEGVQGQLSVSTGAAANALVVPVTAVRGTAGSGEVVVVGEDGAEETREVELGVSDGSSVEVTEGLSVGERVLDPIPLDPRFDVPGAYGSEDGLAEEGEG